ncbi:alpha-sarcoglycan isoform X2 [Agrilus planipennis]|uniref:Alpha-sarcoglycan isoform X2 n=1 Tax=Agrilus planipennis TaxID=224129 RepID=A0A1W4WM90_AGRPL|nr:alpha-sarcoglycan isoform X2 [Agrilus planipennis]
MVNHRLVLFLGLLQLGLTENVLMTEVFEITVDPFMFNWTLEDVNNQYVYQPSLLNSPDLPSWVNYRYSERHQAGFLFGVPPNKHNAEILLQIIALNRKNYETRQSVLPIRITEKLNPARNEVQLKIDNLNVEDMFDTERMNRLKDVFRKKLWRESDEDLYVTFLASAIQMGARLPPNPKEGEGVVIRIGSIAPFSMELIELQAEVKPLEKVPLCPRDFKRTTVERYFREAGFALDWCTFRLFPDNSSSVLQSTTTVEKLSSNGREYNFEDHWESFSRGTIPRRSYSKEFAFSVLLPLFLLVLLGLLLSLVLCFHHEGIFKEMERKATDTETNKISNDHFALETAINDLPSLNGLNFSPNLSIKSRSITGSPTFPLSSDVHMRPSPPPYVRPKFKPGL